jgi:hypothetical protein
MAHLVRGGSFVLLSLCIKEADVEVSMGTVVYICISIGDLMNRDFWIS